MASNVFGNPVTDDTVRLVFPNLTTITARNRSEVALLYMHADEKSANVSRYVHNLKRSWGEGTSTLCMIYNATGGPISFVDNRSWDGNVGGSPFPHLVQNGQWFGYLHVRATLLGPSRGTIVYRGANNDGLSCIWMLAWSTSRMNYQNRVYSEIRESRNGFERDWDAVLNAMERQTLSHSSTALGCHATVATGTGSSPEFVGTMSLDGLGANYMAMASDFSTISQSLDSKYDDVVEGEEGDATPA